MNIKPTAGYILVEPNEAKGQTASGIYLPDNVGEKPLTGKVIAVGREEMLENGTKKPAPAKVGDMVIYKKWGGNEMKIENKDYLFVKFEDILAIQTKG